MGFEEDALEAHNKYRAMHGAPPLTLNRDLCDMSREWAEQNAINGTFEHSSDVTYKGAPVGENLAGGYGDMTGMAQQMISIELTVQTASRLPPECVLTVVYCD